MLVCYRLETNPVVRDAPALSGLATVSQQRIATNIMGMPAKDKPSHASQRRNTSTTLNVAPIQWVQPTIFGVFTAQ